MAESQSQGGSEFEAPKLEVGDLVLYHQHFKNTKDPVAGWVCRRQGKNTTYIQVLSESLGWVEKPSVRHIDDPGLRERAEWAKAGAWEMHPSTLAVKELNALLPHLKAVVARSETKKTSKRTNSDG